MLNIGIWGWGPENYGHFIAKNRALEERLAQLGGRKWLYAQMYYSEEGFWRVYDRTWYERLREKYHATSLPSVFGEVKTDVNAGRAENRGYVKRLAQMWLVGGLYGMWLAWLSGDSRLHRDASWKSR